MSTFILEKAIYYHRKKAYPFGYALNSTCARRFELPTFWSVARRSIQLSYAHITVFRFSCVPHSKIYYSVGPPGCQQVFSTFSNFFHWNFSTLFSLQHICHHRDCKCTSHCSNHSHCKCQAFSFICHKRSKHCRHISGSFYIEQSYD